MKEECKRCAFSAQCLPLGIDAFATKLLRPQYTVVEACEIRKIADMESAVHRFVCLLGTRAAVALNSAELQGAFDAFSVRAGVDRDAVDATVTLEVEWK